MDLLWFTGEWARKSGGWPWRMWFQLANVVVWWEYFLVVRWEYSGDHLNTKFSFFFEGLRNKNQGKPFGEVPNSDRQWKSGVRQNCFLELIPSPITKPPPNTKK